ncbi:hypothetical protein BJ684DRAFT_14404 [Piptocephalis cylindrospora]|uniref:Uncharacterized protein n=1 Tax=Piptocephalis cylindrospora TaxID=1907219 RepID=A0A4P9Y8C8_9FUNG|nr:hypothetical protein BJ684DRAFT_14404 [Piptocephalis cylindrospora]|eukprot:RKP15333.1 hypothetical protein BJ684DRAFT_14404 [Piptocephalis cylindrospora]
MRRPLLNLGDLRLRKRTSGPSSPSSPLSTTTAHPTSSYSRNTLPPLPDLDIPEDELESHSGFLDAQMEARAWALYTPSMSQSPALLSPPCTSIPISRQGEDPFSEGTRPLGIPTSLQCQRLRQRSFDSSIHLPPSPTSPPFPGNSRDSLEVDSLPLHNYPDILSMSKIRKIVPSGTSVSPHAVASINLFISALTNLLTIRIALIYPVPTVKDIQVLMRELLGEGPAQDTCVAYLASSSFSPSTTASSPTLNSFSSTPTSIYSFQRTRDLAIQVSHSLVREVGKAVGKKGHVMAEAVHSILATDPSFSVLHDLMEDDVRHQWCCLANEDPWQVERRTSISSSSTSSTISSSGRPWPVPLRRKRSALPILQSFSPTSQASSDLQTPPSPRKGYLRKVFPIKSALPNTTSNLPSLFGRTPPLEPRHPTPSTTFPTSMSTMEEEEEEYDELLNMGTVIHTHHHLDFLTSDDLYKAGYSSPSSRSRF